MPTRNSYTDGTYEQARDLGYDVVQPKYDGHWCQAKCFDDRTEMYSETDRLMLTAGKTAPGNIFIGEFMRGTQWAQDPSRRGRLYAFDAWMIEGRELVDEIYRDRYRMLAAQAYSVPMWELVQNYPIDRFADVWDHFVVRRKFEGVVFRRSTDPINGRLLRLKQVFTLDGRVIGFEPGDGKHAGRLGALVVQIPASGDRPEATTTVGNGFSDQERQDIWDAQAFYVGKWLEFAASAVFDSGAPRHPRFVRWREDKQ